MSAQQEPTVCHECGRRLLVVLGRVEKLTIPRAKSGDMHFHGWECMERWRERGAR